MPRATSIEVMETTGARLKRLIEFEGMTQKSLADDLCVNLTTINRICRGVGAPRFDLLIQIADYFDVSVDFMIGRKFEKKN